ncbi:PREDICTED: agamous-like MADS-box protein AGL80 [Camelina sativa]|uniref:Agamous-like MADS-box protein AGL80 n=1 Tax=Camelina sativa TaxID=90675 RepID=A0ABM0W0X4_CAMSA|nr:PREDICTED: agamous-like MADS-box protein AGL80 [Camelina sativa]
MTRKKAKLAFITNDASRKATFKKRKKGLLKKVNELSTLCGINACAIIYSPYDSNPEVWPSNSGVQRIVSEFRTLPEMDQQKKMVDQEAFLRQRIAKASNNFRRVRKDNRELEMTEVMIQCLKGNMGSFHMNITDLNDLGYLIDQYLKDDRRLLEIIQATLAWRSASLPMLQVRSGRLLLKGLDQWRSCRLQPHQPPQLMIRRVLPLHHWQLF